MVTNFTVLSSTTVHNSYSWDYGIPSSINTIPGHTTATYVSGYAPHVKVLFSNNSVIDPPAPNTNTFFRWDFNDYYNDDTNTVDVSCVDHCIDHIYVMPGLYSVKLTQYKIKKTFITTAGAGSCLGKYSKLWYWDNLMCNAPDITNRITWDDTSATLNGKYKKTWDIETECLQKHCKNWNWKELKALGGNPIKWEQTPNGEIFEKKWLYEPPAIDCDIPNFDFDVVTDVTEVTDIKTFLVDVKEIPPVASLCILTNPAHGPAPHTVAITPRHCKPGSFPFERIIWDFGDGTPIQTVSRHTIPDPVYFTYTNNFPADPIDPRNYDAIYTYKRSVDSFSMFYPSITAFCSSTNTRDSCSVPIGPITPEVLIPANTLPVSSVIEPPASFRLLKARNTRNDVLYTLNVSDRVGFVRSYNPFTVEIEQQTQHLIQPQIPPNPIRNSCGAIWPYAGNQGIGYPPSVPNIICNCVNGPPVIPVLPPTINPVVVSCLFAPGSIVATYIAQTMFPVDTPLTINFTSVLSSITGSAITTYNTNISLPFAPGTKTSFYTTTASTLDYNLFLRNCTNINEIVVASGTTNFVYPITFNCIHATPVTTITPCTGNLIKNGEFTSSVVQTVGGTADWWSLTNVDVHDISVYGFTGQPSNPFIDLMSCSSGIIRQTVPTLVGATYSLSFDIGGDKSSLTDTTSRTVHVSITDGVKGPVNTYTVTPTSKAITYNSFNWQTKNTTYVATSTTTVIAFSGTTNGNMCYGPVLDNVCFAMLTPPPSIPKLCTFTAEDFIVTFNNNNFITPLTS
jgi:hypothetical protein